MIGSSPLDEGLRRVVDSLLAARTEPAGGDGVPVTVLTGFLGAGKTTLLRHLVSGDHGLRIAVVANDLAGRAVDAELVAGAADGEVIALANGCVCCSIVDDLAATLTGLVGVAEPPDAIVVETSGASDALSVSEVALQDGCRLDGVVTALAADTALDLVADPRLGGLVRAQIDAAHLVVLTKTDLVDQRTVTQLRRAIADIAPGRAVVAAERGSIPSEVLLQAAFRGARLTSAAADPSPMFHHMVIGSPGPVDRRRLAAALEAAGASALRVKGWVRDERGDRLEVQQVGRRWVLEPTDIEGHDEMVVIAASVEELDAATRALGELRG